MTSPLKIVIPMAGLGTRMRPHTWSKPKPLVSFAGQTGLDHLLQSFKSLPPSFQVEYVFIIGYLGEQIQDYMARHHAEKTVHYVWQRERKGQSHALYLARERLAGPMLMIFSDTLIDTDFSFLAQEKADGVAWVQTVDDPRRFGVAIAGQDGYIRRLVEKPQSMENRQALVGCYYFRDGHKLTAAIETQIARDIQLKGEYFLADAINIMLENGARLRTHAVKQWLDAGTIEATLQTNRILLDKNAISPAPRRGVTFVPPVAVAEDAVLENAVIGPYASIGSGCVIRNSRVEDSILESGVQVESAALRHALIGRKALIQGCGAEAPPWSLNVGDHASVRCSG